VDGTNLYAGGRFTSAAGVEANGIAKWNGTAWSALGSGMDGWSGFDGEVNALAVSGSTLYAGGWFARAGGVTATNIAKWDGRVWSALGSGISGEGDGNGEGPNLRDLLADGSGHLFVGGNFTYAGGKLSPFIAQANIGPTPGRFSSLVYSPGTGFGWVFSEATVGQYYRIQTSPSLEGGTWTDLIGFDYGGPIFLRDPSAAAGPKRFYRAVSP
jgi:hypothetical protein